MSAIHCIALHRIAESQHGSICEVSLATLVLGEISQVTAMMRKNARWAGALQQHDHYSYGRDTPPSASSAPSASASTSALGVGASEETTPGLGGKDKELGGGSAAAAGLRGTVAAAAAKAGSGAVSGTGSGTGLAARGGGKAAAAPASQTLSRDRDSNSRSASATASLANQPNSLLSGFTVLKAELREIHGEAATCLAALSSNAPRLTCRSCILRLRALHALQTCLSSMLSSCYHLSWMSCAPATRQAR